MKSETLNSDLEYDTALTEFVRLVVKETINELGVKIEGPNRIKRSEIVRIIGRQRFDQAVERGELKVHKTGTAKSAGVWVKMEDWQKFYKEMNSRFYYKT